jgi:hypothetical protein
MLRTDNALEPLIENAAPLSDADDLKKDDSSILIHRDFKEILETYKEILGTYQEYQKNGAGIRGYWNRYFYGYAYHGSAPSAHQHFIKLIDRFALMDSSGNWIDSLINILNDLEKHHLTENNQAQFMDHIYCIFESWQNDYFENRKSQNSKFKDTLIWHYHIPEKHQEWFRDYFDEIVYDKKNDKDNTPKKIKVLGKITYDLKQMKDHIKEENESFCKQANMFKKTIHHVAEDYKLPSKIKKRPATEETPSIYYVDFDAIFRGVPIEKIKKRQTQSIIQKVASIEAFTSSIGEGFVAVTGIIALTLIFPVFAVIGIVGISGWYINRLLFKDDSEDVLNAFFIKKEIENNGKLEKHRLIFLIKDENGNYKPISRKKKIAICIIGAFSNFTGLVSGALNFISTLAVIFSNQAILAPLCIVSAALPGVGLALAVTWIFFKVIADFIKYDRHIEIARYVNKTFFDVPWTEMRSDEKRKHIGKCVTKTFICLGAIAVTAVVTIASFGVFYNSCLDLLSKIANANPMPYIAKASSWINSIISFPFQVHTSNKVMQSFFFRKRHTFSNSITEPSTNIETPNALQKESLKSQKIGKIVSLVTNGLNGIGQVGVNTAPQPCQMALSTNSTVDFMLKGGSTLLYSGLPNASAVEEANASRKILPRIIPAFEIETKNPITNQERPTLFRKLAFASDKTTTRTQSLIHRYRSR